MENIVVNSLRIKILENIKNIESGENRDEYEKKDGKIYALKMILRIIDHGQLGETKEEVKKQLEQFKDSFYVSRASGIFKGGVYLIIAKISGYLVLGLESSRN